MFSYTEFWVIIQQTYFLKPSLRVRKHVQISGVQELKSIKKSKPHLNKPLCKCSQNVLCGIHEHISVMGTSQFTYSKLKGIMLC
jgi:hypothetical protein